MNRRDKISNEKCYARAATVENDGKHRVIASSEHNHQPDSLKVAAVKHRTALKRKANECSEPPEKIIRHCAAESAVEVSNIEIN